jgi:predicted ArsR family transcriptional regulator
MQGTREQVLEYVVDRRDVRADEVAAAFGMTSAGVRRHLDNLRADGLIDVRQVKQATGRPYYAYFPTERATGTLPPAYASLLARVLESVEGRDDITDAVAQRMAASLAERHRGEVVSPDGNERVVQLTESLRQEGILDSWRAGDDGIHLTNRTCPYHEAARLSRLPCESDRKAIELLLGAEVVQLNRIVDGASCCEYVVQSRENRAFVPIEGVVER